MKDISNINLLPRPDVQRIMWRTKAGEKIAVADMDDEHLTNTYRMCERQKNVMQWWMDTFTDEAHRRGILLDNERNFLKMVRKRR